MTAAIHHFPAPAAFMAQREAEARAAKIVSAARAILRSPAQHDDAILIEAADALMTWGDALDWPQGYAVRRAAEARIAQRADAAAKAKARKGTIRAALIDCAGLAVIIAAALAVYLATP